MDIQFKKLTFSNIMSFGSDRTKIDFNNGLNLIVGVNGSGKSTILEALSYCLYGKPYRKIKLKDIINRKNKKKLYTECEFIKNNKDVYKIIRTMKPDSIRIFKNDQELSLLSSKKFNQEEIDKIIGINHELFKQIISLAVNNNDPFLTLPIAKKREITEQIFNITIFGKMSKNNKKKISDIKQQIKLNEKTDQMMENTIATLKKKYIEIEKAKKNFEKNKNENVKRFENKIEEKKQNINDCENEINILNQKLDDNYTEDLTKYKEKRDELIKKNSICDYEIETASDKIEKMKKISICPECNTEITEEHRNEEIKKYKSIIEKMTKKRNNNEKKIELVTNFISENESKKNEYIKIKGEIDFKNNNKKSIESDIKYLLEEKESAKRSEFEFDIGSLKEELLKKYSDHKVVKREGDDFKEKYEIYQIANDVLSEDGIKAYFFKNLIPLLNDRINDYLKLFEIPIIVSFDEFMNEKISDFNNISKEVSYYSYSEGEKKRIDMAILLSFISVTKTISNWNCNLLMIDELLDSAIDDDGLERLVTSLDNMSSESNNLCIYVISHRLKHEFSDLFSNRIQIKKRSNRFSVIK